MVYQVLRLLNGFVINWLNFLKFILKVILMLTTLYPPLLQTYTVMKDFHV